jgi:hypothetical protein
VTNNLPEKLSASIPSLSERASLFADPPSLLGMDPATLRDLAAEVAVEAGPIMKQVRTMVGLVSWALRSKVPAGEFGAWIQSYSELVGVSVRTLHEWRVQATEDAGIIDPYKSKREPKTACESGRLAESRKSPKPIPATFTEAPAKQSEGSGPGMPQTRPGVAAPSGPSSGGAELQPPTGPTGEPPSPRSAPLDPPRNPTGPVPSLRQEASATFNALLDAPEGIGAKWTVEEATYWENRSQREMEAWRKANKIAGKVTRPYLGDGGGTSTRRAAEARIAAAPPSNGHGSLTRRDVTPMFKP